MALPNKLTYANLDGELADYSPVTDPTTDLSAEANNEARADTAAMTRTAVRAWVTLDIATTTITILNTGYDAVYGNSIAYKPTVDYIDVGVYEVTFPEEITDARNNVQTVNFSVGWANVAIDQAGDTYISTANKQSANVFRVYVMNLSSAGALEDMTDGHVTLFVI